MENEQYKGVGIDLAGMFFNALQRPFAISAVLEDRQMKMWLGLCVKDGAFGGYRNLEWKSCRWVFDILTNDKQMYHVGIDFGQQAVHVTLGPGDVHSLYYKNPWVE